MGQRKVITRTKLFESKRNLFYESLFEINLDSDMSMHSIWTKDDGKITGNMNDPKHVLQENQ